MVQHNDIDHTGVTGVTGGVTVQDEGSPLSTVGTTLNFVGAGVAATGTGATKTITIGGATSDLTLITDILHGSDTASFDFTSIPGTYKHLKIIISGRSTRAANTLDFCTLRINNDSGSNYDGYWIQVFPSFSGASGTEWIGATSMANLMLAPAASSATGSAMSGEITIPDYAAATLQKSVQMTGYAPTAQSTGNVRPFLSGGDWRSTAAITRITIAPANGNWLTGSRASLYGLG